MAKNYCFIRPLINYPYVTSIYIWSILSALPLNILVLGTFNDNVSEWSENIETQIKLS